MARTTVVHITDDLDGSAGADQVTFGYQGVDYTIDLTKKNRVAFEKALKPYIDAARRSPRSTPRRKGGSPGASRNLKAIRSWARENGLDISDRGRVPQEVVSKYEAAHK